MSLLRKSSFIAAILCSAATLAPAAVITLSTNLSGPTSTAAPTTGTGTFVGILDTSALTLNVSVSLSGLTSPLGGASPPAHIHRATAPGGTGAVIIPFPGFPTGVTATTYNQLLSLTVLQYNNLVGALTEGTGYVNFHTVAYPNGEIRGELAQISGLQPIPEPGSVLLIGSGLIGAAALRLRRKSV